MKPKKLKQEQIEIVKRSNDKHNLFTFDMVHPYYYVIENVFSDPKKHMLVYFDEERGELVWMEELKEEHLNTPIVKKWIENYHKKRKKEEQKKEKAKADKKAEREKKKEATKKDSNKKKPEPKPKTEKKKPGPKPKTEKKDGAPRKKPGPKPKNKTTKSKDDKENEKVA